MGGVLNFKRETFHKIFDEVIPLLKAHYLEIAHYKDIELDVDVEGYLLAEERGCYRVYTARCNQNKLIGYAAFFVRNNLHYKQSLQAVQDVVYIDKAQRGFGRLFIQWCDDRLREEGVQVVMHHLKAAHNWGKILEEQGYDLQDLIYTKRLD